ncbi:uroporphyrin-iii c-methyltransferase precorrin-2 dehydrogenase sirohydrochlorin ferrochelatase [Trichoderma cornu-damae]|uniref:Uroporphyrin-iii c-methyltransferase precorrin-2 dehydrogenase sirohydrochlorin ferrochelatase n=1 Tax=Trichoderma cornu-damae TaxID=654480 RepID=A0A9P8QHJ4_9HYPO|nr:uroporphyrin-iii c-methyltransferase precorrin-2 dehydrogenase sirohydrochlorin ferrochelatase [Trichoderma cornu-damae]
MVATPSPRAHDNASSNSMLAGLNCQGNIHLVVGTNPLAAARCAQSLGAGAHPVLIAPETAELHYGLRRRIDDGSVKWVRAAFEDEHLFRLGREEVGGVVDAVFVTAGSREHLASHISSLCKRNRIPVNVVDAPHLCTFSLLSTHSDGPLQIGVTTNGRGCKLASRIRREIASSLPPNLGAACDRFGEARRRIQQQQQQQQQQHDQGDGPPPVAGDLDDSVDQSALFNKLVTDEDARSSSRRMRWLSQVCEYWPLKKLASVSDEDVHRLLEAYAGDAEADAARRRPRGGDADADPPQPKGRIILAGSGPGHPDLLTRATYNAIQGADLVLADKLVPSGVLDLIPRRTPVEIARKFPGNAEQAQDELLAAALAAARAGKTVLRLKQGDPFIYGRGGEELAYFRRNGFSAEGAVTVLPGVTSALSAPLFAAIPATQRDVADQVLVCTGTGKKGKAPEPPEFVASRTVVFLMALHRIVGLVRELTAAVEAEAEPPEAEAEAGTRPPSSRTLWPLSTPCAVIERASCPDQRVIRTTLAHVAEAIEAEGSRPPGLLVVGRSCEFLHPREKGRAWVVEEGFRGLGDDGIAAGLKGLGVGVGAAGALNG